MILLVAKKETKKERPRQLALIALRRKEKRTKKAEKVSERARDKERSMAAVLRANSRVTIERGCRVRYFPLNLTSTSTDKDRATEGELKV